MTFRLLTIIKFDRFNIWCNANKINWINVDETLGITLYWDSKYFATLRYRKLTTLIEPNILRTL